MGRGKDKAHIAATQNYKRMVGRLYMSRHDADAEPVLIIREGAEALPVGRLLKLLSQNENLPDQHILRLLNRPGVKPSDIETLRVYAHRFGYDITARRTIADHEKRVVLLDENAPHPAVLPLTQMFGWATHVGFENLVGRDTPDEDIWDFAQTHEFGAIVTRDTDFLEIHHRRGLDSQIAGEHVPLLLFIGQELSTETLSGLFSLHGAAIKIDMKKQEQLACTLSYQHGYRPLF